MSKDKSTKDDKKMLNSEYHTMFVIDVSEKKEPVTIEKTDKKGKVTTETLPDTYKITPAHKKYRIFMDSFMEYERGLHEMFNTLWNAEDNDELELRINSWGGLVKEGQNFYNVIKNKFNGRTTTILDSAGYSMGAIAMCLGDERICMEQSDLMFHDYSGGSSGKGGEIEAHVTHTAKHLRSFFRKVIVDQGFLTPEEFEKMIIGKDYWMEVPEMCERGIATHVMVDGVKVKAKMYLKYSKGKISRKELLGN